MDIHCIQCGEPWDAYSARHGDMAHWEYSLFRKGAGCPCCKGKGNGFEATQLSHVEFGDEDPMIRLNQMDDKLTGKEFPKWEPPPPTIFWRCGGCGVQVIGNNELSKDDEDYLGYHLPPGAAGNQWYNSHPYHRGTPEKTPAHTFGEDTHVCEFCLEHCEECGEPVCSLLEHGDVYDDGYAACPPEYQSMRGEVYCINCLETMCSECGGLPDDCECIHCEKCGEHLASHSDFLPENCSGCGMLTDKDE